MTIGNLRKWFAIGTAVGIEIGREDLNVTVAKVRPDGVTILGEFEIHRFREQPAGEWGASYGTFLKKLQVSHKAATVLLPREEVSVRQVLLPGVSDRDLASAIRFELDNLHPYNDGETVFDWARIGKTSSILVGIARRETIGRYSTIFAEAGVKVSAFTFSSAAIYSALRLYSLPPSGGFLVISEEAGELETYGESPARPIFSARLSAPLDRARALAISELRLLPETEPVALRDALPRPKAAPSELDLSRTALPYATALAGACPQLALSVNLLPKEQRQGSSRLRYTPTIVLACLLLMMAAAVVAYPRVAERQYLGLLQDEIQKLEPKAKDAVTLDRLIATTRNRSQVIDNFRRQTREDLEAIRELTHVLAPPTWVGSFQLTRDSVTLSGEAEQAAPLLKVLDGSHQFKGSDFTLPITRTTNAEGFTIRSIRKAGSQ